MSRMLTEAGDLILTEAGDAILLELDDTPPPPPPPPPPPIDGGGASIPQSDIDIIEFRAGISQRVDSWSFNLLHPDRTMVGSLSVVKNTAPTLQLSTARVSMRTLTGMVVADPPDVGENLGGLRLQPVVTLENGSQHRLGVLMFGEDDRNPASSRTPWMPQMFDEGFLLNQKLDKSWSLQAGGSVLELFTAMAGEILDPLGIPHSYPVDDVGTASPLFYPVGSLRSDALNSQAMLLGALPPFFDNDGIHRLKSPPTILDTAMHTYGAGTRIFKDSVTIKSTLYNAPNRYIVIGDNINGAPVAGYYDLPNDAPHSAAQNGGRVITSSVTAPGVSDPALAAQIAYVNALTDRSTYGTAVFDAAADPRHGVFDTVKLLGVTYLEQGWSLQMRDGGAHAHTLTRIWA